MNESERLTRIRRALLVVAGFLFAGTIGELIAVKHYDGNVNVLLLPFLLCGLGLVGLLVAVRVHDTRAVIAVRLLMAGIAASSLIGVYQHLNGNAEFARELHPKSTTWELLKAGMTGRDPLMAPGILAVAAIVTIIATFAITDRSTTV